MYAECCDRVGCMLSLLQLIDLCASSRLAWALENLRCEIPIGPSSSDDVRAVGPKKRSSLPHLPLENCKALSVRHAVMRLQVRIATLYSCLCRACCRILSKAT